MPIRDGADNARHRPGARRMASLGLFDLLLQSLGRLLVLAFLIGGLVLAVRKHGQYPRVSLFVAIALVASILQWAAGFGLQLLLRNGYSGAPALFAGFGMLQGLLELVTLGFLVAAAFTDRTAPPG
jgi:hypothetical protein